MTARRGPLSATHEALGAKLVDFGGWSMPLSYPSGTIAEHMACRRTAAIFDVSHLGTVRLDGPGSFEVLQQALSNDLGRIRPGQAQYSHMLDDDGFVLDDVIVWWLDADRFDVMPNASNTDRVLEGLGGAGQDVTASRAVLAVQGPSAREVVAGVLEEVAGLAHHAVSGLSYKGVRGTAAATGYTGEDGLELSIPLEAAEDLFGALVRKGAVPAGLGARDTLRLEAGLPLHGHELGPGVTPLDAGLSFVVGWDKPDFRGKAALEERRAASGPHRRLRGLLGSSRRPFRDGFSVCSKDGDEVGSVTSGNFSPCLKVGIALGFVEEACEVASSVVVRGPGSEGEAVVVRPPFVSAGSFAAGAGPDPDGEPA